MRQYSEYRAMARETLEGRWSEGVLMSLVILAIAFLSAAPSVIYPFIGLNDAVAIWLSPSTDSLTTLISLLILSPLEFAMYNAFMGMIRGSLGEKKPIEAMFSFFSMDWVRYVKAILLEMVIIIPVSFVTLGIGGLILSYAYHMVPFLMRDYPELGAREALKLSRQMMQGYKWDLFVLQFTFLGWIILSILTAGIGMLWLVPYMTTAEALFYQDLKDTVIEEE